MIPIQFFLVFAAILFAIGLYGITTSKKGLVTLMSIELLLNAANINFIAFSSFMNDTSGQIMVLMTIAVAAAEVAVGIAIMLNAYKTLKTTEVDDMASMRW